MAATNLAVEPCGDCGTEFGPIRGDCNRPARADGSRWGFATPICRDCYCRLASQDKRQGGKRRSVKFEPLTSDQSSAVESKLSVAIRISRFHSRNWPELRDDLKQEAFLKLCHAAAKFPKTFDHEQEFENYAAKSIHGACLSFKLAEGGRYHKRPRLLPMDDQKSTEDRVGWEQDSIDAAEGIINLAPQECRDVLRLKYCYGYSGPQIAAKTGLTAGQVEYAELKAITFLRKELGQTQMQDGQRRREPA